MTYTKKLLTFLAVIATVAACSTVPPVGQQGNEILNQEKATHINWPKEYQPEKATFRVSNQIEVSAPPETVWNILVKAEEWPKWYEGAFDVEILQSDTNTLGPKSSFNWNTMGLDFTSEIKEFRPPYRLSWESHRSIIQGYHAWLIVPTAKGSKVITEESQFGLLAYLQPIFVPNKLHRLHDIWLTELKRKAEKLAEKSEGTS